MILKAHEARYIKERCATAKHFTSDVSSDERKHIPPVIRYHSDGKSIRFHYSESVEQDVDKKKWAEEPDRIRRKRGVTKVKWLLSDETNS